MSAALPSFAHHFIGGQWTEPTDAQVIEVISPVTEEQLAAVADGSKRDVDLAVAAARHAFDDGPWPTMSPIERARALQPFASAYAARTDELAALITAEIGSPIGFSTMAQALAPSMMIQAFIDLATEHPWEERRPTMLGGTSVVRRLPVGVVAAITPWNVPQVVIMSKVIPALLAGCTVVLKPAPESPVDALWLARFPELAELPPGVINIVTGGRDAGEHLVSHPGVDKVAFTGSTETGRRIATICAERFARVSLELGGKSAAIVLDDADPAKTAAGLRFASFLNSGQACAAQTRVLVPRSTQAVFIEALAAMVDSLVVGDPADPATEIGPMVSRRQQTRVQSYVELGVREGARLVRGGAAPPAGLSQGWFTRPTLFAEVDNRWRIAREEVFGPVLCVIPYDDEDHAIALANDSPYGLAGSVWTADVERGEAVAGRVRTGTTGVNHYAADFGSPFGGFKASGIGREYGPEGLDEFVELQSISLLPGR